MPLLILTLPLEPANAAALLDCVQSADGSSVASSAALPLTLLPPTDRQTEVVAVVPLSVLSWHRVVLPPGSLPRSVLGQRNPARLRAILDGLLEDQLLDDPAQLHLALQPQPQVGVPLWVAACDRAWLQAALGALTQAGLKVTRIVPESSPQSLAQTIEVTGSADQPWVAGLTSAGAPDETGVLHCALSPAVLGLLAADAQVLAEPAVAALAEQQLGRPVTLQQHGARLLQAAQQPWDLAQFEFTNAERDPRWAALTQALVRFAKAPQWRAGRWALAVLLLGNLVGLNAWALRESSLLQAQRQQVRAVLTDTFAQVPVVVDAPLQMAREVAALERSRGTGSVADLETVLSLFSALAPVGYVPIAIDYAANELRLSGPAMAADAQQRVIDGLRARGLTARLQGDQWLIRAEATR